MNVEQCVAVIEQWMSASKLGLNMKKPELMLTRSNHNLLQILDHSLPLTLGNVHITALLLLLLLLLLNTFKKHALSQPGGESQASDGIHIPYTR